jgi:hypothetical protein
MLAKQPRHAVRCFPSRLVRVKCQNYFPAQKKVGPSFVEGSGRWERDSDCSSVRFKAGINQADCVRFALTQIDCRRSVDEASAPKPRFSESPSQDSLALLPPAQFDSGFVDESEFAIVPTHARLEAQVSDRLWFPAACSRNPFTKIRRVAQHYGHLDCAEAFVG